MTTVPTETRSLVLVNRPREGLFSKEHFEVQTRPLPQLSDGEVLVQVTVASLDPTHRIWATDAPQYMEPVNLNEPMRCIIAGVVVASNNPDIPVGTHGTGVASLSEFVVIPMGHFMPFLVRPKDNEEVARNLAIFSVVIGLTAWASVVEVLQLRNPEPDQVLVVSGAAGAVGSLVGQFAKLMGVKTVIGIAGSDAKVKSLTDVFGFDAGINYKTEDITTRLKELAPNGVNAYHDNVGGTVSAAVLPCMALNGRVSICGLIEGYSTAAPAVYSNFQFILHRRLTVKGFICMDFMDKMGDFMEWIVPHVKSGKIAHKIDLQAGGLEGYVDAVNRLFTSQNTGKLCLTISNPF